jgi:hypothetical protein
LHMDLTTLRAVLHVLSQLSSLQPSATVRYVSNGAQSLAYMKSLTMGNVYASMQWYQDVITNNGVNNTGSILASDVFLAAPVYGYTESTQSLSAVCLGLGSTVETLNPSCIGIWRAASFGSLLLSP